MVIEIILVVGLVLGLVIFAALVKCFRQLVEIRKLQERGNQIATWRKG